MSSYGTLADWYDDLTRDVPYAEFVDYYERVFAEQGIQPKLILDLCCGTGTVSCLLTERKYEVIASDASPDMLMSARRKIADLPEGLTQPLLICQPAEELDLYGTVDAAISTLDSLSYLQPSKLPEVFRRLRLFVRPGGSVIFDMRTPEFLRAMDGSVSVDELEDIFCVWRGRFEDEDEALHYDMDIFSRRGASWIRSYEEHIEYAVPPEHVLGLLNENGFEQVQARTDGPQGDAGRIFFTAIRGKK